MQMVGDTIFKLVVTNNISVKVKPTRASNRPPLEVSAAVAGRSHLNVNTRGVPTFANGEDSVTPMGMNPQGAKGSKMMGPRVPTRQKRMDSVGDTGVKLGGAHVGGNDVIAPNVTPWVTLGGSPRTESGGAPSN